MIRILHVDDDSEFLDLSSTFLARENDEFAVTKAQSASDGLDLLAESDFDCIVSDFQMPRLSGLEFLDAVREGDGAIPFILFTGRGSEEVASQAISRGVTDYVQKGHGSDHYRVLANRISNAVARYRAERNARKTRRNLDRVYERITDGFLAVDTEWRYTHANARATEMLDRPEDELLGETIWEVFPGLRLSPFETAFRRAMGEQETTTVDAYYPPHDTHYFVRVFPDESGISIFFTEASGGHDIDLDARFYETVVENDGIGIAVYRDDGEVTYANSAFADLLGLPTSDLVGTTMWKYVPDLDINRTDPVGESDTVEGSHPIDAHVETATGDAVLVTMATTRKHLDGTACTLCFVLSAPRRPPEAEQLR